MLVAALKIEEQPAEQMELEGVVEKKPIEENRADDLKLNTGQTKVLKFLDKNTITLNKDEGKKESIISGYAGTGKTTIIENIVRQSLDKGYEVHVAAPTNKAVYVLMEKAPDDLIGRDGKPPLVNYQTIHKLIYGEPDQETGIFKPAAEYGKHNIIIIDRSSMIDEKMYQDLKENILDKGGKIIFFGDGFQLPPIGKDLKY